MASPPAPYSGSIHTDLTTYINQMIKLFKPRLAYWDNFCSLFSENEGAFHKAVYPMPKIEDIVATNPMATRYTDENGNVIVEQTYQPVFPINYINLNLSLEAPEDTLAS